MLDVKCKACGKRYNYHECGCCPSCGAYNRPPRREQVTAEGDVYHVTDSDYRDKDKRTETQGHKVCFEKKVCYEDQAHTSTDYSHPSAYYDGYEDFEDETTDYEEAMEERFEAAAQTSEARFDHAASRFDDADPGHSHARTVNVDVDELGQKLGQTFDGLMGNLKKSTHKSYTQKTGSRSSESGGKVVRVVVKIVVAIIILNVIFGVLSSVMAAFSNGLVEDFFQEVVTPDREPAIPEEFADIYDDMEWIGESMSLLNNEAVYSASQGDPFVIGGSVGAVSDYLMESGEDAYGWGQIVTVELQWMEGDPVEPVLMSGGGSHDWESNYYWEMDEDEDGMTYQFLIDSEDEDVALKVVFEDYSADPSQEVQIDLQ